jgi:lipoprotein-anchoring transpeptidase ErfK/SrfK
MRRICQFTSPVFAIVAATCGTCLARLSHTGRGPGRRGRMTFSGGDIRSGGARPVITPVARPVVAFPLTFPTDSIVIDTGGRKLYYVLPDNKAYAYPISVGREGFDWAGTETISRKQAWPDWYPPTEMRERDSSLPEKMTAALKNPLGSGGTFLRATLGIGYNGVARAPSVPRCLGQ